MHKHDKNIVIAHLHPISIETDEWAIQSNEEHCKNVAKLAKQFADNVSLGSICYATGLLHDKGKEQPEFQEYIRFASGYDNSHRASKVPHAYVGALIARTIYTDYWPIISYSIMGHHAGLKNRTDFMETMKKSIPEGIQENEDKIDIIYPSIDDQNASSHVIRFVYSCLVDADYLDTEQFMNPVSASMRGKYDNIETLSRSLDIFLKKLKSTAADTPVNQIRAQVQARCKEASQGTPGFYSLTVPTGGGKTISSLVWAINHAKKYGKERIIIAIPFTSIVTQTADILKGIFGEANVLEHHSNVDYDKIDSEDVKQQMHLATENWDYPIIVTTNVQLFESMFASKPSKCRKLHNLANSVIILDEAQTLPLNYLQPIVDALNTYQSVFNSSVLFTTASQPTLEGGYKLNNKIVFNGLSKITEIIPEEYKLHEKLRRVNLHFETDMPMSPESIADRMCQYNKVLCIVNTRDKAQAIFEHLPKEDGITLHLSRMMCSEHLRRTIKQIKDALREGEKVVRVVATQLIEAGVDIDFPIVLREEAGLDSILQAAGRCNREGKLSIGDAYVFSIGKPLYGFVNMCNNARKNMDHEYDWFSPEAMKEYFRQLYCRVPDFDEKKIGKTPKSMNFEQVSEEFKLIEDKGKAVIVNYGDSPMLIDQLKKGGISYGIIKKLSQYTVNINKGDFDSFKKQGMVEEIIEGVYFIPLREQYDEKVGLIKDNQWLFETLIC